MDSFNTAKRRKLSMIVKTWRRIHGWRKPTSGCSLHPLIALTRSKTWLPLTANSDEEYLDEKSSPNEVTPRGHVAVYVGDDQERFVIKTEYVNHPLFKNLLDEAEREFGFQSEGPLVLPCQVAAFHKILWTLESDRQSCKSSPKVYFKHI
ncbi:hypothetical protein SUGI_0724570 [Cryptomeria japonica]|nr:hypothetical protein SUGI_0724570 [Cryptomeria japonica]